jgi:hypothetical protein
VRPVEIIDINPQLTQLICLISQTIPPRHLTWTVNAVNQAGFSQSFPHEPPIQPCDLRRTEIMLRRPLCVFGPGGTWRIDVTAVDDAGNSATITVASGIPTCS